MTPTDASEVDLELGSVQHTSRVGPAFQIRSGDAHEHDRTETGSLCGSVGLATIPQAANNASRRQSLSTLEPANH